MLLARYARGDIAARIIKRILRTFLSTEVVETRVTEDEWTPGDISAVKSLHPFSNSESFTSFSSSGRVSPTGLLALSIAMQFEL
jgi:hypothetical protein